MSSRNAVKKISGSKFTPIKAGVQQIDEENESCQIARQVKNKRANRKSLGGINPNRSERAPFLIPEVTAKVVEAAPSTTIEQPSNRVTRSQTKRAVETEQPLKGETKNSNKENESCAPQGFVFTAPKEIAVKDIKFQDSIHVQSTESNLPSRKPKGTSVGAESEDSIKIPPLNFNNPWVSTMRGSSSKNLQVTDVEKKFAGLGILKDTASAQGSGKRKSLKRSVLFDLAKTSVFTFTVTDSIHEEPAEFTPSPKKTFGRRVGSVVESINLERHLSGAVDAVKSQTECFDRVTPLKVSPSPRESIPTNSQSKVLLLDNDEPAFEETPKLRRSARLCAINSRPVVPK
ncbi:hypothetical protein DAPPUDRAFT_313915 [Daphnia pulex]|uniref:Uncharacterized protein n=1 Tax=Daphnia pulex TaxID=6669 RepID=E9G5N9_DAPPU|nr:hypothetical protein DAPPUDRAFT_313915 [Daphnia pulex]|eukprot:EFX85238.1 hypothetical protein DAPPUDRAFT_313915 [Daphnia pulex]